MLLLNSGREQRNATTTNRGRATHTTPAETNRVGHKVEAELSTPTETTEQPSENDVSPQTRPPQTSIGSRAHKQNCTDPGHAPVDEPRGGVNGSFKIFYKIHVTKNIHTNVLRRRLVTVSLNIKHTKKIITQHKNYPGSDLLSLGVLRPVPEQQLRISLTKGTVPLRTQQHPAQLDFLHTRREQQHPGYLTRSSFTTEGNYTLDTTRNRYGDLRNRYDRQVIASSKEIVTASKSLRVLKKSLRNDLKKTVELSSFGRLKEEKLELHHHPRREAATSTQRSQLGVNGVNRHILHRQRRSGTSANHCRRRPHSRHSKTEAKRNVHSSFLAIAMGPQCYCGLSASSLPSHI
ncbi:hypothetical protein Taro_019966 [Colocasia esculenta]|uniref:Uncharacterized protein n=1 Tax=Colocasia esculenta TaxID=4460 RepID=A0A843UY94_COLES|nr:hypothetical protein [Colocasia esculenta]